MEYLNDFEQPLKTISETDYVFYDKIQLKSYIYGANFIGETEIKKFADLSKVAEEIDDSDTITKLTIANSQTSGVRLRFYTDSSTLVIKTQLKRKYAGQVMLLSCSSGFDIYYGNIKNGTLTHATIIAPEEPNNIFAHKIVVKKDSFLEIYFPNYNSVEKLSIGIEKGKTISEAPSYKYKQPIIFYGNSITQGASASRSGNAFANIVERQMNCDIINYSFSESCKGELSMARLICDSSDACAVVIDYSRNASNYQEFVSRYEPFYLELRKHYKNIPIVLVTAFRWQSVSEHIKAIHEKYKREHNLYLVDVDKLFSEIPPTLTSIDNIHFTDIGMFAVADEICSILSQKL